MSLPSRSWQTESRGVYFHERSAQKRGIYKVVSTTPTMVRQLRHWTVSAHDVSSCAPRVPAASGLGELGGER